MGDHSSRPYVAGRLKRPTRRRGAPKRAFGRAALYPPPYLVLHREEFAWPRMSPHAPVRSYFKPRGGPHRFTHHPLPRPPKGPARWLVCSLLHLSSHGRPQNCSRSLRPAGAPPLAGSLPFGVRTFLSRPLAGLGSDRPTRSQIRGADYSKAPLNTYSPKASTVKL